MCRRLSPRLSVLVFAAAFAPSPSSTGTADHGQNAASSELSRPLRDGSGLCLIYHRIGQSCVNNYPFFSPCPDRRPPGNSLVGITLPCSPCLSPPIEPGMQQRTSVPRRSVCRRDQPLSYFGCARGSDSVAFTLSDDPAAPSFVGVNLDSSAPPSSRHLLQVTGHRCLWL